MKKVLPISAIIAIAVLCASSWPAFADRRATPEEPIRIEQQLRRLGFQSWKEIELDDGQWEIDDARHADGKKYELNLKFDTLELIKQKEDD